MSDQHQLSDQRQFNVLIVDDQPENIAIAANNLKSDEISLSFASTGREALERLEHLQVDLFLLDIMMPEMDGYELCRIIKQKPEYKTVPVIFLTAKTDQSSLLTGFDAGAVDYISKPFFGEELRHRVHAQLELRFAQRQLESFSNQLNLQILKAMQTEQALQQKQEELERANKALSEMASYDPLTGLLNRRKGWDYIEYEAERSDREQRSIGCLLLDIDHFKQINDSLGHDTGDQVLAQLACTMKSALRKQDIIVRWGGEEFLIALPETDIQGALTAAEKIHQAIAGESWPTSSGQLTVSIGATAKDAAEPWNTTISRADKALYTAKESGRNRTCSLAS
ncbi:diguanylate cyclase [Spirochaeta africana]|uniref:diguanylate cyclase n=1 Tax=Spirochaeta africana (strain ATCC 700263 / DSM 8902 / Z-7692) TaxID=889378 RepID=H9UH17_SPIAZ|nr:diguanylate cyclase [Spirochaeta africana]AFG36810.1 diguanylate cyclase (GGDEF) domain-containing protein [Spirochaeta africana DSM 8902]